MPAAIGTIPALPSYQPGALPITGQELVEIASTINATAAVSASMLITDLVGKTPSVVPAANPNDNDRVTLFQAATGTPVSVSIASIRGNATNNFQFNNGTISSGVATINIANSVKQRLTVGGAITIVFTNWATNNVYTEVEIELINGGTNVTWPTVNWLKGDGTNATAFSSMGVTLNNPGTNWVIVWSRDGGATLWGRAA